MTLTDSHDASFESDQSRTFVQFAVTIVKLRTYDHFAEPGKRHGLSVAFTVRIVRGCFFGGSLGGCHTRRGGLRATFVARLRAFHLVYGLHWCDELIGRS